MKHYATASFWKSYQALPAQVRELADKNFRLLKQNPDHNSLWFKNVKDGLWSARVGMHHRALQSRTRTASPGFGLEPTPSMTG